MHLDLGHKCFKRQIVFQAKEARIELQIEHISGSVNIVQKYKQYIFRKSLKSF